MKGWCDIISVLKIPNKIRRDLLSKIEWENDLVKYTKIILPIE